MGVQKELDKLKQEKRGIKKQLQLADGIVKKICIQLICGVGE